jgi:hypothetical protein
VSRPLSGHDESGVAFLQKPSPGASAAAAGLPIS